MGLAPDRSAATAVHTGFDDKVAAKCRGTGCPGGADAGCILRKSTPNHCCSTVPSGSTSSSLLQKEALGNAFVSKSELHIDTKELGAISVRLQSLVLKKQKALAITNKWLCIKTPPTAVYLHAAQLAQHFNQDIAEEESQSPHHAILKH